jgi:integrase
MRLTKRGIGAIKPSQKRFDVWDSELPNFALRVQPDGSKSFFVRYRLRGLGRRSPKRFVTIGAYGVLTLDQARAQARSIFGDVAKGQDPVTERRKTEASATNTLEYVAEKYFAREGDKLRTGDQRRRLLERLVYPRLGGRQIAEMTRGELITLLDKIEDENGERTADMTLAVLRRIFNWHAVRDETFRTPVVKGMARGKPKETARARILSDDELRRVWTTASEMRGPFPALIKFLVLSTARRAEAARMSWDEIEGDNWVLPPSRNKTKEELVRPLSMAARQVLGSLPRFENGGFIFTSDGKRALAGFSKAKRSFDKVSGVQDWVLHDLRRTARSLMSRAGVPDHHAERCLGHVIGGVKGIYDRHRYGPEMLHAYEALAGLIERIVHPQPNVVALQR